MGCTGGSVRIIEGTVNLKQIDKKVDSTGFSVCSGSITINTSFQLWPLPR